MFESLQTFDPRRRKKKPSKATKGYRNVTLVSPNGKNIRQFTTKYSRLPDSQIHKDPVQLEIKQLLAKGWRVFQKMQSSQNKMNEKPKKKQQQKQKQQAPGKKNSFEREGPSVNAELSQINLSKYQETLGALLNIPAASGDSEEMKIVKLDVHPVKLTRDKIMGKDWTPRLAEPMKSSIKKILISVDVSGSCMDLIPLSKALAQALVGHPEIYADYGENFNGRHYSDQDRRRSNSNYYDYVIYFGDTDFIGSEQHKKSYKTIALMKDNYWGYPLNREPRDNTYMVVVDFSNDKSIALGIGQGVKALDVNSMHSGFRIG